MDSKEFGLVAAQQLFQIEDIHYGFWENDMEVSLSNFKVAQEKHTNFLFKHINDFISNKKNDKILDIGCGVGLTTKKLLENNYRVDGLVPYNWMAQYAERITSKYKTEDSGKIFECKFEEYPIHKNLNKYSLLFFSESYQYVNMKQSFEIINKIIDKNGHIVIFDFFKKDDVSGNSPLGGGHYLSEFYNLVSNYEYTIIKDLDITKNLSPNLTLVSDVIKDRIIPFTDTFDKFMIGRHQYIYKLIKWLLRKKINKMKFKYSVDRNEENFVKYKTYRLIVLKKN